MANKEGNAKENRKMSKRTQHIRKMLQMLTVLISVQERNDALIQEFSSNLLIY